MRPAHPFRHTLHAFRASIGSFTEGPRDAVCTRLPNPVHLRRRPSGFRASLARRRSAQRKGLARYQPAS
eukprot:4048393-Pyramimonas_sp.AAC.1